METLKTICKIITDCKFTNFCISQINPFTLSEDEKILYSNFGKYLIGEESDLKVKKGILLRGVVGSGKTIMFKMAQRFKEKNFKLKFINTNEVVSVFELNDEKGIEKYLSEEWVFDDLGAEQKANNYGKAIELFKIIIERRYDKFKFQGLRTHFTTNSTNDELRDKYGDRVYDRIKEMCNVELYPADSSKRGKSEIKPLITNMETIEKTQDQKDLLIIKTMDEIFEEINAYYKKLDPKKGADKLSEINAKKFYSCLKYFNMLPTYTGDFESVPRELWEEAKDIKTNSLKLAILGIARSLSEEDRSNKIQYNAMLSYIKNPKTTISHRLKVKITSSVDNIYKSLLVIKYLVDLKELLDELKDAKPKRKEVENE